MDELDALVDKASDLMGTLGRLARADRPADADDLNRAAIQAIGLALELYDMANAARLARRNASIESAGRELREVLYAVRGDDEEALIVVGYWADGHDWIGKREFIPANGSPSLFLFDDEVLSDEPMAQPFTPDEDES